MKLKQKYTTPSKTPRYQQKPKDPESPTPRSFRSKLFEKSALKPIPKIKDRQIFVHSPPYESYLSCQFNLNDKNKVPQIWGCIIVPPRKANSVRQNYLKRDIDTPKICFGLTQKEKSKLIFGIPITKQFEALNTTHVKQFSDNQSNFIDHHQKGHQLIDPQINPQQENVSAFFTDFNNIEHHINQKNSYSKQKVKRYQDLETEQIKASNKFTDEEVSMQMHSSRFRQKITQRDLSDTREQVKKLGNKSIYKMSIEQLRESIKWKKHILQCLKETMIQAKEKRV